MKSIFSNVDNQLLKDILGYVKGIFELMQENASLAPLTVKRTAQRSQPITAKRLRMTVQDLEESYHEEHGYYADEMTKEDEESENDDNPPIEFNSVEYITDEPNIDSQFSTETVTETKPVVPVVVVAKKDRSYAPLKLDFPLTTPEELNKLEEEIAKPSSTYRKQLIETIHTIQGKIRDHRVTIRTFFRVVFHDILLINYTWKGHETKRALCEYKNIMTFLKKILVRWFPDDDLSDFSKCIQNYVKNIAARLRNIQEKREKRL